MKGFFKDAMLWVLAGIGFLGLIIMYGVWEASVFNFTYFMIGAVLAGVSGLILWSIRSSDYADIEEAQNDYLDDIIGRGDQIVVDLPSCEVISNEWRSEIENNDDYRVNAWNSLAGYDDLNVEVKDHHVSRIIHRCEYNNARVEFISAPINRDIHTLKMLMEHQKTTVIYVKEPDYYFDVSFLDR